MISLCENLIVHDTLQYLDDAELPIEGVRIE